MTSVSFSKKEQAVIEQVAFERGITADEAANLLVSEGLARRVKRHTGRNPSSNVRKFRKRKN